MTNVWGTDASGEAIWLRDFDHPRGGMCPFCEGVVGSPALVDLAYAFEVCHCASVRYPHLVEVVWHRECLVAAERAMEEA